MKKTYSLEQRINTLFDMSVTNKESQELNQLLENFNEEDLEIITKACGIHFKIGFRSSAEFLG